jgi:hypothetical protein
MARGCSSPSGKVWIKVWISWATFSPDRCMAALHFGTFFDDQMMNLRVLGVDNYNLGMSNLFKTSHPSSTLGANFGAEGNWCQIWG